MSERKYIRSATMEVITNQIKDHLVEKQQSYINRC